MDVIGDTPLITELSGEVYLSNMDAVAALKDGALF